VKLLLRQETRTVDDAGLVQVDASYYPALPTPLFSEVTVRVYERQIEILDARGEVLRRHDKSTRKGAFCIPEADRIFNPSRETARLIGKVTKIGPNAATLAREIFARLGRPGQHAIWAVQLTRHHTRERIERACEQVLTLSTPSYQALKRILERHAAAEEATAAARVPTLQQSGEAIRAIDEYRAFWEEYSASDPHASSPPQRHSIGEDDEHVDD
jgi:hypothetical protein